MQVTDRFGCFSQIVNNITVNFISFVDNLDGDNCEILLTDFVTILAKIIFPVENLAIVFRPLGNSF